MAKVTISLENGKTVRVPQEHAGRLQESLRKMAALKMQEESKSGGKNEETQFRLSRRCEVTDAILGIVAGTYPSNGGYQAGGRLNA